MSDWQQHQASVAAAVDAIGGLQERLSIATEGADQAIGAIIACTGSSSVESAVNAMNLLQRAKELIDEAFSVSQAAIEETERYGRGF